MPFSSHFRKHSLQFRNHWHKACLSVLRRRHGISAHMQLGRHKVSVSPSDKPCLANPNATIGEESHQVCTVFRLTSAGRADHLDEPEEFFT